MQVGYGRTSTIEQEAGLEAQERDLKAAGAEKLFLEQISSVATERPELERALDFVRQGDVLIITKPDRAARSTEDLLRIVRALNSKGVGLIVLSMGGGPLDTRTPTGKLMITILAAIAEFERGLMLERQREGIAKAKAGGKYKGRPPLHSAVEVARLLRGGMRPCDVARELHMHRGTVYGLLTELPPEDRAALLATPASAREAAREPRQTARAARRAAKLLAPVL